uniref:Ig-like domain-containing protein n=1 Tax=Xiphophorus maculatus TaxID=8083 RepID=M4AGU4_XIPMA
MNLYFGRRDRLNQEMASSLPASLFLLSVVFCQFVSAAGQIHLHTNIVKITATVGDDVILPCKDPDQKEIIVVEWSRTDLGSGFVLLYRNLKFDLENQLPSYTDRVDLLVGQIKKGDASLVLKNTTTDDSGTYECYGEKLMMKDVWLKVRGQWYKCTFRAEREELTLDPFRTRHQRSRTSRCRFWISLHQPVQNSELHVHVD